MALTLSKQFMRMISQNPNENQTGISLWTLADIERAQAKQRELALARAAAGGADADAADGDGAMGVGAVDGYKFVPAVAALGALTVLVCPFQVAYKPQRDKFLA